MKRRKVVEAALIVAVAYAGSACADILMEVDFSGSGGVTAIAATDSQVTTHANLNYDGANALSAIGGWVMDGTGDAAVNVDLHTAGDIFGAPTRMDLFLGVADAGYSYTITNVEIVVRAAATTSKNWEFMYRDTEGVDHFLSGTAIAVQGGTDPRTTYSIDLSGESLTGTSSSVSWDATKDLRVAFWESDGGNNDNLQIDAIRLNGTVIPEPATLGLVVMMGGGIIFVRRRFML